MEVVDETLLVTGTLAKDAVKVPSAFLVMVNVPDDGLQMVSLGKLTFSTNSKVALPNVGEGQVPMDGASWYVWLAVNWNVKGSYKVSNAFICITELFTGCVMRYNMSSFGSKDPLVNDLSGL